MIHLFIYQAHLTFVEKVNHIPNTHHCTEKVNHIPRTSRGVEKKTFFAGNVENEMQLLEMVYIIATESQN